MRISCINRCKAPRSGPDTISTRVGVSDDDDDDDGGGGGSHW